ncbi:hypothetical protein HOD96_03785 [Candidatus Falkowbacteria bacterium]|jgi:uncharacterized protein|nr:hypothetical protein [Candidatus Falkowbacteria bacterium]MBT4432900.1 hypothetical protein [Candidatus Falkowbacteria bacterium]
MKKQVLVIHGGETFAFYDDYFFYLKNYKIDLEKIKAKSKGWKKHLQEDLGDEFEVIQPQMPSFRNAKYKEWKIWLEKYLSFLHDDIILIGHSLGGKFWAKYLSENSLPVKISQLHLVAAPFGNNDDTSGKTQNYDLIDFNFSQDLSKIEEQVKNIFLYHSEDDPLVPFIDLKKYTKALPNAEKVIFKDKGHFSVEKFSEILKNIKQ